MFFPSPDKLPPNRPLPARPAPAESPVAAQQSTTLEKLGAGDRATIVGYADPHSGYARRLMSLGLTPGTGLHVVRRAPLGDPVEIRVRGYHLLLRRDEARGIALQRVAP